MMWRNSARDAMPIVAARHGRDRCQETKPHKITLFDAGCRRSLRRPLSVVRARSALRPAVDTGVQIHATSLWPEHSLCAGDEVGHTV